MPTWNRPQEPLLGQSFPFIGVSVEAANCVSVENTCVHVGCGQFVLLAAGFAEFRMGILINHVPWDRRKSSSLSERTLFMRKRWRVRAPRRILLRRGIEDVLGGKVTLIEVFSVVLVCSIKLFMIGLTTSCGENGGFRSVLEEFWVCFLEYDVWCFLFLG